jgi:acyl carrier protein
MHVNSVEIENRIKNVIKKRLKLKVNMQKLSKDTPLIGKGLGLDSVGVLELVVGLEEEFNIMFEDSELRIELFENIGSLTNYINEKLTHP